MIQASAAMFASSDARYWSKVLGAEVPIEYGENPVLALLSGEAEPFHVVFGGLTSPSGAPIPDLGLFILGVDFVALDYRMATEWDSAAVEGLFSLMRELSNLAVCRISHTGNIFDPTGEILCSAFEKWLGDNH